MDRRAEADFFSALREYRARQRPNYDATCFFSQQCIEKYSKARLAQAGQPIPKTHDLPTLLDLLLPLEPLWTVFRPQLETLTSYAVVFRYPGESATREMAKKAIGHTRSVRSLIQKAIGL